MKSTFNFFFLVAILLVIGCKENDTVTPGEGCTTQNFFSEYPSRNFKMGFSTWIYAPNQQAKEDTYRFIGKNADIYSEHIDDKIPWHAWMNNLPLPVEFTDEIASRVSNKIANNQLVLSVSLLNDDRSDLAEDFDGSIPGYTALNDQEIEDAYFKHVKYLVDALDPDYLIIAIEVNELKLKSEKKWSEYKLLIHKVKTRIKDEFPGLILSESITLHNFYLPDISNPDVYIDEIAAYANQMDLVTISYYPFFKGQHTKAGFQQAFDFLHGKINKPIAFVETSHLAKDLSVSSFNLFITGDTCEQNAYLETLITNAQEHHYAFVIWWAHRDFDALWQTFPDEQKDLGKLWRNTGVLDDNGNERPSYLTWKQVFSM
jgi:hypothetical protein